VSKKTSTISLENLCRELRAALEKYTGVIPTVFNDNLKSPSAVFISRVSNTTNDRLFEIHDNGSILPLGGLRLQDPVDFAITEIVVATVAKFLTKPGMNVEPKYQTKQLPVEAIFFHGNNGQDVVDFFAARGTRALVSQDGAGITIPGVRTVYSPKWVVKRQQGDWEYLSDSYFQTWYEEVK